MAKRYEQMIPLIHKIKPRKIVEVGVHRAMRANKLCRAALEHGPVEYVGYDVFETMGQEFQDAALNGKGEPTERAARRRLDAIEGSLTYSLVIGDTRDTLHGNKIDADFAFIDGDHRVDAIAGDYEALSNVPVVVLDDYFEIGTDAKIPNLDKYGCNQLVWQLMRNRVKVEVLPIADGCKASGVSHLVVVYR